MRVKQTLTRTAKMVFLGRRMAASGFLLISLSVQASPIPEGEWVGSVHMPEQTNQLADFNIRHNSTGSVITMFYNERPYLFEKLDINNGSMTFELDTGSIYQCELLRDSSDNFSGECISESEEGLRTIKMNLEPPGLVEQEPEAEPEPDPEAGIEAETEASIEGEAEIDQESEVNSEPEADSEPELETEPEMAADFS